MSYPPFRSGQSVDDDPIIPFHTRVCALCTIGPLNFSGSLETARLCELELPVEYVSVPERGCLFEQGAYASHVFMVREGVVRLTRSLPDGRRQIIGFGLPGNMVGFQIGEHYSYSVEAVTPTSACRFPRACFLDLADKRPLLTQKFLELLGLELSTAQEQITILGYRSAEKRVASFLINLRDRWARITGGEKIIPMPMTRQDIADYLGLRVETVSRTISQMSREMLIETGPGHVRILNDGPIYGLLAA